MDEFLRMAAKGSQRKSLQDLETEIQFLPDDEIIKSAVYSGPPKLSQIPKLNLRQSIHIPGGKLFIPVRQRSKLKLKDKRDCLKALALLQSGRDFESMTTNEKNYINSYRELQPEIALENKIFLEYVKDIWDRLSKAPVKIKKQVVSFAHHQWMEKINLVKMQQQFYKSVLSLSLYFDETKYCINYQHIANVLELGSVAKFIKPLLVRRCHIKNETYPDISDNNKVDFTLPVSLDRNVRKILETNKIDVVMSSSALKRLANSESSSSWAIPILIEDCDFIDGEEKIKRKIVFIDKVLPKVCPIKHDFDVFAYKRLVRTNLCSKIGFDYPNLDVSIETEVKNEIEVTSGATTKKLAGNNKIYRNAIYRTWKITKTIANNSFLIKNKEEDSEMTLLVRSKLDACELTGQGKLQPVIVRPKIEQQVQFGANIPTKTELFHDWVDLFFRPFSVLYRARIVKSFPEIISIETCSMLKINNQAHTHYNAKTVNCLGVLQKIFEQLVKLSNGHYLLQYQPKNDGFLTLLTSCDEKDKTFDLGCEYSNAALDQTSRPNWLPIDCTYILPAHEARNQLPATFAGFMKPIQKKSSNSKNTQNAGKTKKKKNKQMKIPAAE